VDCLAKIIAAKLDNGSTMLRKFSRRLFFLFALLQIAGCASTILSQQVAVAPNNSAGEPTSSNQSYRLVVSVSDQKTVLLKGSATVGSYVISTATNGVGETVNSGRTPRGRHAIAEKIGAGVPMGTIFEDRLPTKNIAVQNATGDTAIVTRILRLRGLEDRNQTTFDRLIYLHGTTAENLLGKPVSGGTIRMRSEDIVAVFERVEVGTEVFVFEEPIDTALVLLAKVDTTLAALQKAAESGSPSANGELCYGHMYGAHGIPKDVKSAIAWCSRADSRNDPNATTLMGEIHEQGLGVPIDLMAARRFYERAAKMGQPYAQFVTAKMYQAGIGGLADGVLAKQYLELSAKQGHPAALKLIETAKP
jgi:hypothetical protein